MRKLFSLFICVMLLFTMAVPAFAEEGAEHTCSWDTGTVTRAATCTTDGEMLYTCSCGATKTEAIPATGHTYGSGTKVDENNHEVRCSVCGTKGTFAHTWEVSETINATCQQAGQKSYICTGCNATKQEVLEKTAHKYSVQEKDDVYHTLICGDCGHYEDAKHTKSVQETPATCKSKGSKVTSCTVCGWKVETEIPMLTTHVYDNDCDPTCNSCDATRTVEHQYTTAWSCDSTGHWHECTKCQLKKDYVRHTAGPAATEDNAQVCTVCNYQIKAALPHNHKYGTTWTTDEVGHWHECSGKNCTSEKDYASHTFDDDCDEDCNVCGYKREASHPYEEEWRMDDAEHWKFCPVCEEDSEHEGHEPGEEATDEAPQLCTVCGYELVPIQAHEHDFGNEWIQTPESHWQECKCGEVSVPESHIWDEGVENRKEDTITYTCSVCGAEKVEEAPSSGFPWIVLFVILALLCVGGIVAIVIVLKRDMVEEDDDEDDEV